MHGRMQIFLDVRARIQDIKYLTNFRYSKKGDGGRQIRHLAKEIYDLVMTDGKIQTVRDEAQSKDPSFRLIQEEEDKKAAERDARKKEKKKKKEEEEAKSLKLTVVKDAAPKSAVPDESDSKKLAASKLTV